MARTEHVIHQIYELQKARFDFALDCLHHADNVRSSDNIAFSPYSLYEGLTMIYFASSDDTDKRLKYVLKLPDICKTFWVAYNIDERMKENKEESNGFYDQNICWINKTKQIKDITSNFFNSNKLTELDFNLQTNLMHRINEILKNELQNYVPEPIEFSDFNESMEFILSSVLCFRNDTFQQHEFLTNIPESYFQRQPRTVASRELNMLLTELPFINKTQSFIALFPAVQDSETWEIDENIDGLIKRITTSTESKNEFYKMLNNIKSSTEEIENIIYPDHFELEYELQIEDLLSYLNFVSILEPHGVDLHAFTHLNPNLGGVKHRTYIKVTEDLITASTVNVFFTKFGGCFNVVKKFDRNIKFNHSFVWMIYDRFVHTILFMGIINKDK